MALDNINGTTSNDFAIGNMASVDGYVSITANIDYTNNPQIRFNTFIDKWEFSVDGTNWSVFEKNNGWTPLFANKDFSTTAASISSITMNSDQAETLLQSLPVKILDGYGVNYADGYFDNYELITGITSSILDAIGRIYISTVDDGGGFFHFNLYNRAARNAASLIGHSATYNSTGNKAIIEDNGSGIGGFVNVLTVGPAQTSLYVEFYKWFGIASCTSSLLTLAGPTLSTASGVIKEMWYGQPEKIVLMPILVSGSYAASASSTVLASIMKMFGGIPWDGPSARLIYFKAGTDTVGAAIPKVNVSLNGNKVCTANSNDGLTLSLAQHWYSTSTNLANNYLRIVRGNYLEITTTIADATAADLSVSVILVLE